MPPILKVPQKKIGVLFSGGLDSAALVALLSRTGHEIWPLYIRFGLRWEQTEITWARRFLKTLNSPRVKPLTLLNLPLDDAYRHNWSSKNRIPSFRSPDRAVFLPARNLLLSTKALLYLSTNRIWSLALGTLKGNPFSDARRNYFRRLNKVLELSFNHSIAIETPLRHLSKKQVLQMTRGLPLHLSLSCLNPKNGKHCGVCNKCAERKKAFRQAGRNDETSYARG